MDREATRVKSVMTDRRSFDESMVAARAVASRNLGPMPNTTPEKARFDNRQGTFIHRKISQTLSRN